MLNGSGSLFRSEQMRSLLIAASFAAALVSAPLTATAQNKAADRASQKFMTTAVEGNLAEAQMCQLAQQKGNSEGVRSYGQMLQQDHSAAAQSSTAVATQLGVTPPSEPNKKQKTLHQSLSKMSGEAFDRKFVAEMIKDHKKEIAEYSKVARKQDNPAGAYAAQTLPTLQKHLETAQSLSKASGRR
jgi:putative membrane protein